MITCSRRIQFCAGHRVHLHESKCRNCHGHNYVAVIEAHAPALDQIGRVIDFSVLKAKVGGWIEEHWDHGFIYWDQDEEMREVMCNIVNQKSYEMPTNPTAENMANYLLRFICPQLLADTSVEVVRVLLHETENCSAEATLYERQETNTNGDQQRIREAGQQGLQRDPALQVESIGMESDQ